MENKIEVVRINRLEGNGALKAFCDISLYNTVVITGIRIVEGKNGLFVSMPREQGKDGKWYDTIRLLSNEIKQVIENTVLEAYAV